MTLSLQEACERINDARLPEDLFGVEDVVLPQEQLQKFLEGGYRTLKAPLDSGDDDPELPCSVDDTLRKLELLYQEARDRISRFQYGMLGYDQPPPRVGRSFTLGANRYLIGAKLNRDDEYDRFQAYLERDGAYLGEVEIKLASEVSHNPLLERELRAFDVLHKTGVPQWKHLPYVMDRFESNGRRGIIYRSFYGLSLSEVRKKRAHARGVDQKHVAWMLDRTLSALGYVHKCGLVHGALEPETLFINDRTHNVIITQWGHSVHRPAVTRESITVRNVRENPYVPPEALGDQRVGPWSDIYALGKTMIWCLGGDPVENSIPPGVEQEWVDFLLAMVHEDPYCRSRDCWELYEQQCRIKDSLWPRKFLHFDVT